MIKPQHLQPGMTIGLIAPASSIKDVDSIDKGIAGLENLGYKVKAGKFLRDRFGYLGSHDTDRLNDLNGMFKDKKVDAVMAFRGGYGTMRIVSGIDFDLIKKNPKIFIGFSDITMINNAILKKCKLVNFSGPMAGFTFADTPIKPFTLNGFNRTLTQTKPAGSIWQDHSDRDFKVIRHGEAEGILVGGNLCLLAASIGTPYEVDTKNKIVFFEEIDEQPYRIDRMITQMLLAGKLADAKAIVIGRNVPANDNVELEEQWAINNPGKVVKPLARKLARDYDPSMNDIFCDLLRPLNILVLSGLPFGHIKDYATMPLGVKASVNSKTGDLIIEESAVK